MAAPQPTEGELAILRILWARETPATVREVHEELLRSKETAYTTVLKMLTIMAEKKLVGRDESERSHRYYPLHTEPVVQSSMLKTFLRNAFSGSAYKLVQRALDEGETSDAELDAITRLIAEARQKRKT
ncbi:MAG: BlaI/MecI/CopY family transcriptional regulator [Ramlibacter sp.]